MPRRVADPDHPCAETLRTDLEEVVLWCNRGRRHTGRHAEKWVASWGRDGKDVRWCSNAGDPSAWYPVYDSETP